MQKTKAHRRRSARVQLKIPVTVSGVDGSGFKFQSTAETVSVSKHGARVRTQRLPDEMRCGGEVSVTLPKAGQSRFGRVVWLRGGAECGLELEDPNNFWGVSFPPRDGEELVDEKKPPKTTPTQRESARKHPAEPPPAASTPAAARPRAVVRDTPVEVEGNPVVLVTGISSTHSAFQERTTLTAVEGDEGSVVLREPLNAGTAVRVLIGNRPVKARVVAVLKDAQPNKSLVRLKFAEAISFRAS